MKDFGAKHIKWAKMHFIRKLSYFSGGEFF